MRQLLDAAASLDERLRQFERLLGLAGDAANPFGRAQSLAADEAEEFPADRLALLWTWGYAEELIPRSEGGRFQSLEALFALQQCLARRDLTVAIAVGQTFLGALPVWLAGTDQQKAKLAALIRGGGWGCLALTEQAHGSDLLATEAAVAKVDGGEVLTGSKWLINNATRGAGLCVLARTKAAGGIRGLSLLMIDKAQLEKSALSYHAKIKTLGIRGADISGISFHGAKLEADAIVGRRDAGFDLVLKTLQVSRSLCPTFSLGAAEACLELAYRFTAERQLYGASALSIPAVSEHLGRAFICALIADTVALTTVRAMEAYPRHGPLWSAVAKAFLPQWCDQLISRLGVVLGARSYLREEMPEALYQKMLRDARVVGIFDGSTEVNLSILAGCLSRLATVEGAAQPDTAFVTELFSKTRVAAAPLSAASLTVSLPMGDPIGGALEAFSELADCKDSAALALLVKARRAERYEALASAPSGMPEVPAASAARRYCVFFAASCWVGAWRAKQLSRPLFDFGMQELLRAIGIPPPETVSHEAAVRALEERITEGRSLGLVARLYPQSGAL